MTDIQIWNAVQKYKKECKKNKIEQQYIKHGDTFFNKAILDYTTEEKQQEKEMKKQEYKEVCMSEDEYFKKVKGRNKRYV